MLKQLTVASIFALAGCAPGGDPGSLTAPIDCKTLESSYRHYTEQAAKAAHPDLKSEMNQQSAYTLVLATHLAFTAQCPDAYKAFTNNPNNPIIEVSETAGDGYNVSVSLRPGQVERFQDLGLQ